MITLDGNQIRHLVDVAQLYTTLRHAQAERMQRFSGSMSWKTVGGRDYLYRKPRETWESVGARSDATELAHARFHQGRDAVRQRIRTLDDRIRAAAPVSVALRLGRVPLITARILRRLERSRALGRGLLVVGTQALYAYEMLGGVHFAANEVATRDVDLLYDARRRVTLAGEVSEGERPGGLTGLLRQVDRSFQPADLGSFRAVNDEGFMVDLITPQPRRPATTSGAASLSADADDLRPVEIEGLAWLAYAPMVEATCIDERGYPLTIPAPDPRAFALHKYWLAHRADRDPAKRRRDRAQARAVAALVTRAMPERRFDAPDLSALPAALRALAPELTEELPAARRDDWD